MGEVDPNLRCHGNMMRYQLVFIFILFFIYTHTHTHTHTRYQLVEVQDFWQMNHSIMI